MYFRRKTSAGRAYLQIVESRRDGDQVRQQVIATLGRYEELQASGQLERLLQSGARFVAKAMVLAAAKNEETTKIATRSVGPSLVFERLWEETGCCRVITELALERKHGFALERAVFLSVLHRIFISGSDRAADRWREDYAIGGIDGLELHHLYRAMAWLGEELPDKEQDGRTPFAPRCTKDVIEEELFAYRRDLFTRLDLVFMDTTSLYFEGAGGQTLGRHGYSKDHRPDLRQMILAVLLDGDGRPWHSPVSPFLRIPHTAGDGHHKKVDCAQCPLVVVTGVTAIRDLLTLTVRPVRGRQNAMSMSYTTDRLHTITGGRQASDTSDVALLRSISTGDKHAMQILFARHNLRVFRFLLRFVAHRSAAERLVSEGSLQ